MIDKENEVFTRVRNAIVEKFPKANVSGVYINAPSAFPHIYIEMTNASEPRSLRDGLEEKYTEATFQIDIYSNKKSTAKSECKAIEKIVDSTLRQMNFRREYRGATPNMNDSTIYRLTLTYVVMASENRFYSA